ncbi:serine-rich adhesin for platelets, partial [Hyalella azteca]|uniref:Serine-rich adhesin for platelets n=1 Tax=Hyalella azteca TaxID=294128 RepID=A0A8B7NUR6_HYAAZ
MSLAYPPPQLAYPPHQLAYPPHQLAYPPHQLAYPPLQLAYPPHQLAYPPHQLACPPLQLAYPPHQLADPPHRLAELQIATGEWMNQYAKRCPPSSSDVTAPPLGDDLLTPKLLPPSELIRRTLARRSFAGPTTAEVPNIFVVPPPPTNSSKFSTPSGDARSSNLPESLRLRRLSLDEGNSSLNGDENLSASKTDVFPQKYSAPKGKTSPPVAGDNQNSLSSGTGFEPPLPLRLAERHSTSSLPRIQKREESTLARHSSPLPLKSSSRPSSRSNSPQQGDAILPQPIIKRRVLPNIPTSSEDSVTMRNKHARSPSDPPFGDTSRHSLLGVGRSPSDPANASPSERSKYPFERNPPDGSSYSQLSFDVPTKNEIQRDSNFPTNRGDTRRMSHHDVQPSRNMREEFPRSQPEFHKSLSNLHSSHRKADALHMSQDSLDDVSPTHRGDSVKDCSEVRGSAFTSSNLPERRNSGNVQRPSSKGFSTELSSPARTPGHDTRTFLDSSNRQSHTLPRRPHSTHGEVTASVDYGSLKRGSHGPGYSDTLKSENIILPQPTRAAPTTVNQILYGSAGGSGRNQGQFGDHHELVNQDSPTRDLGYGDARESPPRITSVFFPQGFATTGRARRPSRPAGEILRRSKSFHEPEGGDLSLAQSAVLDSGISTSRGNVAKYVQELEKGIKSTVDNMLTHRTNMSSQNDLGSSLYGSFPKKDLKYSHSFKYPHLDRDSEYKKGPSITHSHSFKLASSSRDLLGHQVNDRYRPYVQPRRSPSSFEQPTGTLNTRQHPSSNEAYLDLPRRSRDLDRSSKDNIDYSGRDRDAGRSLKSNTNHHNHDRFLGRSTRDTGLVSGDHREQSRFSQDSARVPRDHLTLDLRSRSPRRNITNEIINSESLQLLKKYSQESPTWCGVDSLAKRRWDRHATNPDDLADDSRDSPRSFRQDRHPTTPSDPDSRKPSWRWSDDLSRPTARRYSSDDVINSPSEPPSNRHSFYDAQNYRSTPRTRVPEGSLNRRRPLSDATLGDVITSYHDFGHERSAPEGDDYKLVFISSDSSKGSDLNTSGESEANPVSKVTKANSFHGKSQKSHRRVDAAVNTERFLHNQEESPSDQENPVPVSDRKSRRTSREDSRSRPRSKSQHGYDPDEPPPRPPKPSHLCPPVGRDFFPPLGAIHPSQLQAMLQQTEVVQAEAQALQAALMGAFSPTEKFKPSSAKTDVRENASLSAHRLRNISTGATTTTSNSTMTSASTSVVSSTSTSTSTCSSHLPSDRTPSTPVPPPAHLRREPSSVAQDPWPCEADTVIRPPPRTKNFKSNLKGLTEPSAKSTEDVLESRVLTSRVPLNSSNLTSSESTAPQSQVHSNVTSKVTGSSPYLPSSSNCNTASSGALENTPSIETISKSLNSEAISNSTSSETISKSISSEKTSKSTSSEKISQSLTAETNLNSRSSGTISNSYSSKENFKSTSLDSSVKSTYSEPFKSQPSQAPVNSSSLFTKSSTDNQTSGRILAKPLFPASSKSLSSELELTSSSHIVKGLSSSKDYGNLNLDLTKRNLETAKPSVEHTVKNDANVTSYNRDVENSTTPKLSLSSKFLSAKFNRKMSADANSELLPPEFDPDLEADREQDNSLARSCDTDNSVTDTDNSITDTTDDNKTLEEEANEEENSQSLQNNSEVTQHSDLIKNIVSNDDNDDDTLQLKSLERSDDNDEAFDDCDSESSASDTDDDVHVSCQYDVNRSSSTSDIENVAESDEGDSGQPANVTEMNTENTLKNESTSSVKDTQENELNFVGNEFSKNPNVINVVDADEDVNASQAVQASGHDSDTDETFNALSEIKPSCEIGETNEGNLEESEANQPISLEENDNYYRVSDGEMAQSSDEEKSKHADGSSNRDKLNRQRIDHLLRNDGEEIDNIEISDKKLEDGSIVTPSPSLPPSNESHVLGGNGGQISPQPDSPTWRLPSASSEQEKILESKQKSESDDATEPGTPTALEPLKDVTGKCVNDVISDTGNSQSLELNDPQQQQLQLQQGNKESLCSSSVTSNRSAVACGSVESECVSSSGTPNDRDILCSEGCLVGSSSDEISSQSVVSSDQVGDVGAPNVFDEKSQVGDREAGHLGAGNSETVDGAADRDCSSARDSGSLRDPSSTTPVLKSRPKSENLDDTEVIRAPKRTKKRSSSSEGLSSSSDLDRSDASDSADTIIERSRSDNSLKRLFVEQRKQRLALQDKHRSASDDREFVLTGDSESQHSDNSEEGNLVSIVSVGGEDKPAPLSHGRIYIRSDSTDSDVQIKPTCIVVTGGSSGAESSEDCDAESLKQDQNILESKKKVKGSDVTILEVSSKEPSSDHIMSVQVTSPSSSRSGSPSRQTNVLELQDVISLSKERQEQFQRSRSDSPEPTSGLANYFTLTLGFDSPHTPRRLNKTPEVRRRTKTPDRTLDGSPEKASTSLTPSPVITPTPEGDASPERSFEGDQLGLPKEDRLSDNREVGSANSMDDSQHFSSGTEEYEERDSFDHEYGDEMNEEEYFDDEYDDDDDYGFDAPLADVKNCRPHLDLTLHTIIEESCEESDCDRRQKDDEVSNQDPSELEKYFFFGLGNGTAESKRIGNEESEYSDSFSETSSSIFNESLETNDGQVNDEIDPAELASSRLEKYFLTGLGSNFERQPSIRSVGEDSELHTDESGSVGSDSEGSPSPEQPRKKLLRPRGFRQGMASRGLGYSSDRGEYPSDGSHHSGEDGDVDRNLVSGEDEGSTESEEIAFDKVDGQFDTIKRRKKKKNSSDLSDRRSDSEKSEIKAMESEAKEETKLTEKRRATNDAINFHKRSHHETSEKEANKDKDVSHSTVGDLSDRKYQSRDSGFIGSSDDLLKDKPDDASKNKDNKEKLSSDSSADDKSGASSKKEQKSGQDVEADDCTKSEKADNDFNGKSEADERSRHGGKVSRSSTGSSADLPPFSKDRIKVSRKDSFNWSSDEETNIMMNRMRIFFRNMLMKARENVKEKSAVKSPQLLLFEAKLTSLMKKVPDINDEQVKEIVEYLSSEDTWSDSYDSSDYTASDLEASALFDHPVHHPLSSELSKQISASCQQIIQKFDQSREPSDTDSAHSLFGGRAYSESSEDVSHNNKETLFMYQRLLSTIGHMKPDSDRISIGSGSQNASPPLLAKVFHHIGTSLVELMHEVSGGSETGDDIDSLSGRMHPKSSKPPLFAYPNTSFESDGSATDTEQSPESGTPKLSRKKALSIISERSSAEDFTSLESQRTVFASHDSPRHYTRPDSYLTPQTSVSQRSLEERGITSIQYYVTEGSGNEPEVWQSVTIDEDKFDAREHIGVLKAKKSSKRPDTRKAKSHMSLEKIQCDDIKTSTGERSESLGDLCDRFRHSDFSTTSSYEQLDSDSTLKASDSLDRHIGSSSSNIRLNASSRGSLTTSSRGSLAASSRGSLQGSSGPEDEEEKKSKKLGSFFRYPRRSSIPDPKNDRANQEVRSTTLPRSTPAQLLPTATLPRTLPSSSGGYRASPSYSYPSSSSSSSQQTPENRGGISTVSSTSSSAGAATGSVPRSARYHAPGYRPPPSSSKRNMFSTSTRKGFRNWSST